VRNGLSTGGMGHFSTLIVFPPQRSDAARYFIVYHHGGVYLDLDYECSRPFAPVLAGARAVFSFKVGMNVSRGLANAIFATEVRLGGRVGGEGSKAGGAGQQSQWRWVVVCARQGGRIGTLHAPARIPCSPTPRLLHPPHAHTPFPRRVTPSGPWSSISF
jgi:hypothetical protein